MEDSINPLEENDWPFGLFLFSGEFTKCDISEVLQKCSQDSNGISSFYNKILRDRELDELLPHIKEIKELMHYTASHGDLHVREPFLDELQSNIGRKNGDREDVVADLLFDTLLVYIEDQNFELRDKAFRILFKFLESISKNVEFIERKIPAVLQLVRRSRRYCTKKLYSFAHRLFKVLAYMAYLIGPQKTEELILQSYLEFCLRPNRYVMFRHVSVMIFPTICYIMGTAYTEEKLLDHFADLCKDKSWVIRNTAASYVVHMSLICTLEVRKTRMTKIILDLAKDKNKPVVTKALLDLGKFISTLAVPCITGLVYATGRENEICFPNANLEELHVISPTMNVFRRFASPELLDNYQYYADKYYLQGCQDKNIPTETVTDTRPKCNLAPKQISERIASTRNRIFRHSDGFCYSLDSLEFTSTQSLFDLSKSLSEPVPYSNDGENSWTFTSTDGGMQDTSSSVMDSDTVGRNIGGGTDEFSSGGNRWLGGPSDYIMCFNGRYRKGAFSSSPMTGESITSMFNKVQEGINRGAINIDVDTMNEDYSTEDEEDDMPEFNSNWYWSSATSDIPLDLSLIEKKRDKTEIRVPEYMLAFEEHYAREMPLSYEQNVVPPEILKTFFASIAFEYKENMKLECASNIPAIAITLGRSNWHILRPFFRCLCDEIDSKVTKTIASYIVVLANLLGKEIARRDLVPVFIDFLKNHDDVKNEAILNLIDFMKAIWFYKDELFLKVLVTLYQGNEVNWHVINELAKKVYMLVQKCNFITNQESFLYVTSFAAHLLEDKISFNRTLGSHVLAQTLRVCQQNEMEGILHFLETEYAMSDSFKRRQSYVHVLVNGNKNGAPRKELLRIVLPIVERLSVDHISNVRLVVARYLVKSIESGEVTSTLNSSEISTVVRMLKRLGNDEDGVIRDLISQITETNLSEVFNIAGYLDDEESQEENSISSVSQEQHDEEPKNEINKEEQGDDDNDDQKDNKDDDIVNDDQSVPNERTSSTASTTTAAAAAAAVAVDELTIKLKDAIVFESQL